MQLQGQVVVITGAARGIGRCMAVAVLEQGGKVVVADLLEDVGRHTVQELQGRFGDDKVIFVKCDVTKEEDCEGLLDAAKDRLGPINVFINNAAILSGTIEAFPKLMEVNVMAVVRLTKMVMARMDRDQGGNGGIIVNMSSIAGVATCPGTGFYTASKYAVTGFTRCMGANCRENPSWGIKVYSLAPCWVKTEMTKGIMANLETTEPKSPGLLKYIEETGPFVEPTVISDALVSMLTEEPDAEDRDFLLVTGKGSKYLDFKQLYL